MLEAKVNQDGDVTHVSTMTLVRVTPLFAVLFQTFPIRLRGLVK